MVSDNVIRSAIPSAFKDIDLSALGSHRSGKVREIYDMGDKLALIATDRVSAFDVVLPRAIPFKGRTLSETAKFWFDKTKHIVQNQVISYPHPNVTIVKKAKPYPVEVIIRSYVTGHLWREYAKGKRELCGIKLPDGLKENQKLPAPILTPTTKTEHDEDISREELLEQGLVPENVWKQIEDVAMKIFTLGQEFSAKQDLILVDTKYEFADYNGELILIDEVHTSDSSRFWVASEYQERFDNGEKQRGLDKEYIRQWLREQGFTGKHDDAAIEGVEKKDTIEIPDEVVITSAKRYIEAFEKLTGQEFKVTKIDKPIPDKIQETLIKEGLLCWFQ
ncbi:phosphoribosylaminoimidazolesuccinocarboxamide synthase [Candidatus Woesearchaeota archaeon]|jgi:phosphoribosylaminoimidazole-succinocarboxamide synthase|nr:phosphoribosylaminoimidazolesuccinocarboxamide synthase [Candidatus Woesearchaeota archaeon]MBT7063009.1 phosphoribosylaminoimidazolesuccinocarboxamide synthase [Candidatus Woesearchaeota archaeon]MBT7402592.1 phosphoribosylaminoimidazolesuccinocarboxamide synthase [Candidatus Woesearchaeota archaeon]